MSLVGGVGRWASPCALPFRDWGDAMPGNGVGCACPARLAMPLGS